MRESRPVHLLLTNYDGIDAPGLTACVKELRKLGELTIVAPTDQRSAISHAITLFKPLMVDSRNGVPGQRRIAVDGTPADCVKLAFAELCPRRPDVVISGINFGSNLGVNVFYSGTVAAAVEAAIFGVPGIALSLERSDRPDFAGAIRRVRGLLRELISSYVGRGIAFNVNIPARGAGRSSRVIWTRMDTVPTRDQFSPRTDPRGRPYFWIGMDPPPAARPGRHETARYRPEPLLDQEAFRAGHISVTPLTCDLTHFDLLLARRARKRPGR